MLTCMCVFVSVQYLYMYLHVYANVHLKLCIFLCSCKCTGLCTCTFMYNIMCMYILFLYTWFHVYCSGTYIIYIYIFTSLRDGNRPHRIVGLTQQGHDSGAERKVERRSWGAKSVVEWWVTKSWGIPSRHHGRFHILSPGLMEDLGRISPHDVRHLQFYRRKYPHSHKFP